MTADFGRPHDGQAQEPITLNALFIPCYVDGLQVKSGSVNWRARWPAKYWPTVDPDALYRPGRADVYDGQQRLSDYQIFIFQKVYRSKRAQMWIRDLTTIRELQNDRTVVMVLDMCDPDWLDTETRNRLLAVLPMFDLATGPTRPLTDWLGRYLPAYIVMDGIDTDAVVYQHEFNKRGRVSVCWIGYTGNLSAIDLLKEDLQETRTEVDVIELERPVSFAVFLKTIARYDILLNPRPPRAPYLYKSSNKSDAAWMLGVAAVERRGELQRAMNPTYRRLMIAQKQRVIGEGRNAQGAARELWNAVLTELLERRDSGPADD